MIKFYKHDEWEFVRGEDYTPDTNIYVDLEGNPITGMLENFYYYSEGDINNNQYVENGNRKFFENNKPSKELYFIACVDQETAEAFGFPFEGSWYRVRNNLWKVL